MQFKFKLVPLCWFLTELCLLELKRKWVIFRDIYNFFCNISYKCYTYSGIWNFDWAICGIKTQFFIKVNIAFYGKWIIDTLFTIESPFATFHVTLNKESSSIRSIHIKWNCVNGFGDVFEKWKLKLFTKNEMEEGQGWQ